MKPIRTGNHAISRSVKLSPVFASLALTLLCLAASASAFQQNQSRKDSEQKLPPGKWSVSGRPYLGPDHLSLPAVVTSVRNDVKGPAVTGLRVRNNSSKSILAVKLSWRLSAAEDRVATLQEGQTPLITLSGGIPEGKSRMIDYPVVSFANIYKPLVKEGKLTGEYSIEVAVSEVLYSDGSTWKRD